MARSRLQTSRVLETGAEMRLVPKQTNSLFAALGPTDMPAIETVACPGTASRCQPAGQRLAASHPDNFFPCDQGHVGAFVVQLRAFLNSDAAGSREILNSFREP